MNFACRFVAIMIVGLGIAALLTLATSLALAGGSTTIIVNPSGGSDNGYILIEEPQLAAPATAAWYCPLVPMPSRLWAERCVDTRPDLWTRVALAIPPAPRTDEWR